MIPAVTSTTTASAPPPAFPAQGADRGRATLVSSDFETFLRMLTTQMQNQDPLNPLSATDFAVQLATFSGVEQQVRTNELLKGLGAQLGLMGLAQAASWVGMEVRAEAPGHLDGGPVQLSLAPAPGADRAVLIARNAFGIEVDRREVPLAGGPYSWEGLGPDGMPLPAGLYSFTLESLADGVPQPGSRVEVIARVEEARMAGGEVRLLLAGGAEIPAGAVSALRPPR